MGKSQLRTVIAAAEINNRSVSDGVIRVRNRSGAAIGIGSFIGRGAAGSLNHAGVGSRAVCKFAEHPVLIVMTESPALYIHTGVGPFAHASVYPADRRNGRSEG